MSCKQCDQIERFIGLWANFQSLWQQLICPNLTFLSISCKSVKIFNFSCEIILGNFYRHLATFVLSHWLWAKWKSATLDLIEDRNWWPQINFNFRSSVINSLSLSLFHASSIDLPIIVVAVSPSSPQTRMNNFTHYHFQREERVSETPVVNVRDTVTMWPDNTHLLCKSKFQCIANLLFAWFGFDKNSKYVANSAQAKQLGQIRCSRVS